MKGEGGSRGGVFVRRRGYPGAFPFFLLGVWVGGGGGERERGGQSKEFPIVLHFIPYALANVVLLSPI